MADNTNVQPSAELRRQLIIFDNADKSNDEKALAAFKTVEAYVTHENLKARLVTLKLITANNFANELGTYDFDGIAENVFDEIEQLEVELKELDK